ncbi:hypothetical protein [Williamsia sp. M5A3_1d]
MVCGDDDVEDPDAAESVCGVVDAVVGGVVIEGTDVEFAVSAAPVAFAAAPPEADDDADGPAGLPASVSAAAIP